MIKKVLFICPYFLPDPLAGDMLSQLQYAQVYKERGYDITFLTHNQAGPLYSPFGKKYPPFEEIEGYKIIRLKNNFLKNLCIGFLKFVFNFFEKLEINYFLPQGIYAYSKMYIGAQFIGLKKFLEKNYFDIIYVGPMPYEFNLTVVDIKKKLKLNSKLICKPHIHKEKDVYHQRYFKRFYEDCDLIIVVTTNEKEFIKKTFGISGDKILVSHLFIDVYNDKDSKELDSKTAMFKSKNQLDDKITVLGIGYPFPETKGIEYTIMALSNLSKKYQNLALIIISGKIDLSKYKELDNLKILNLGKVDEQLKNVIFNSCDIFCMPSQSDSFGITFLEASLRKKPIICFNTEAQVELFSDGAIFAKKRDLKDLENKLETLINDKAKRVKIGNRGYEKLIKSYSKESFLKDFQKIDKF